MTLGSGNINRQAITWIQSTNCTYGTWRHRAFR